MFEKFLEDARKEFNEFQETGMLKEAVELRKKVGQHFNSGFYPHYFTGDLNSKIVFVQLNPHKDDSHQDSFAEEKRFENFKQYMDSFLHYGRKNYLENDTFKSDFDPRQMLFIKQFGIIDFKEDKNGYQNNRQNLAKLVDCKLQLELIPYGSHDFKIKKPDYLEKYIERVLYIISQVHRDYVIFCGRIFEELLKKYIIESHENKFILIKKDGNNAQDKASFIKIKLNYKDKEIKAGIAPTYAKQSINGTLMEQYGCKCRKCFDDLRGEN